MLLEVKVLNGRLLMTTLPISQQLIAKNQKPVARQLRYAVKHYMASKDFNPSVKVEVDIIRHLFEREAPKVNMYTKDSPDELKPKIGG